MEKVAVRFSPSIGGLTQLPFVVFGFGTRIGPVKSSDDAEKCAEAWDAVLVASREEVMIATNVGTYTPSECFLRIGTQDVNRGDYRVFQRVGDGRRRNEGCSINCAPGYPVSFCDELEVKKRAYTLLCHYAHSLDPRIVRSQGGAIDRHVEKYQWS